MYQCESPRSRFEAGSLIFCVIVLLLSPISYGQQSNNDEVEIYFVSAAADANGDGSPHRPFRSLSQAESVSSSGDTIYLISHGQSQVLDGGISLKPRQKLIGIGMDGQLLQDAANRVRLSNTTAALGGVIVRLSDHNEIAGIHFLNMRNSAIEGSTADYSGTYIHHATFSGNAPQHIEDERGLVYAISLDASAGQRDGIRIEDSSFYEGEDLGAIRVFQSGNSSGSYHFQRNTFSDLGGRAYFVRTQNSSRVETVILDSSADNIGRGDRNSDSIIPYLMGQSEQIMLVRNYHFKNTKQVGSRSNTAIEAYMFGQPRPDQANWCTACKLTLKIIDSVIENAVTDPIQFSNAGSNSQLSYEISNTRIIGGNPQQGGGAISLNLQGIPGGGGSTKLMVENSDIVGSTGYGFAMNNRAGDDGHVAIIDFGGGALGSEGGNRFLDNARGDIRVPDVSVMETRITARGNWWNGGEPKIYNSDNELLEESKVWVEPILIADPH